MVANIHHHHRFMPLLDLRSKFFNPVNQAGNAAKVAMYVIGMNKMNAACHDYQPQFNQGRKTLVHIFYKSGKDTIVNQIIP
jgi:hypothetical protein